MEVKAYDDDTAREALTAYDALNIESKPFGPYTFEEVIKDAVTA